MSDTYSLSEYADIIREVLDSGGEFTLYPRGTSMLPLIVEGRDSVTLEKRAVTRSTAARTARLCCTGRWALRTALTQCAATTSLPLKRALRRSRL